MLSNSLLTKYPLSVAKLIPIQIHAIGDYGLAALLVIGAVFFYADVAPAFWSHLILGLVIFVGSLLTAYREDSGGAVERTGGRASAWRQ